MTETARDISERGVTQPADGFAELDDVEFLDDIDFTLEDLESKIAPLALA